MPRGVSTRAVRTRAAEARAAKVSAARSRQTKERDASKRRRSEAERKARLHCPHWDNSYAPPLPSKREIAAEARRGFEPDYGENEHGDAVLVGYRRVIGWTREWRPNVTAWLAATQAPAQVVALAALAGPGAPSLGSTCSSSSSGSSSGC